MMNEESFTVSELNNFIKDIILAGFPQPVWVCGEIQGFDRQREKNHIFFQLIEKDDLSHQQKACIDLVIWAGNKPHIKQILKSAQETFDLKDDIEVKFLCRVDFYPPHGRVRLAVESIDPFFTLGKLAQEKQKLIQKLTAEGTLEKNKLVPLSPAPLHIGLITSDDSAAYNDFIGELKKSGCGFKVYLRNTLMQGKKTERDVVTAMEELGQIKSLDAIVITRGGGSLAELSCFDSELIARKIAAYHLPVLSGIGHEINITITDLASQTHAKTPTAIAQFLIRRVESFLQLLDDKEKNIMEGMLQMLDQTIQRLKTNALTLQSKTQDYLKDHHVTLIRLMERMVSRPTAILKEKDASMERFIVEFNKCVKYRLQKSRQELGSLEKIVEMAHPVNTLKRGFSITRGPNGKILRNVDDLKLQDMLITQLASGALESKVEHIKKDIPLE